LRPYNVTTVTRITCETLQMLGKNDWWNIGVEKDPLGLGRDADMGKSKGELATRVVKKRSLPQETNGVRS